MKNKLKIASIILAFVFSLSSCNKDEDVNLPIVKQDLHGNNQDLQGNKIKNKIHNAKSYPVQITLDINDSTQFASAVASLSSGEKLLVRYSSGVSTSSKVDNTALDNILTGGYPIDPGDPNLNYVCQLSNVGCADAARAIHAINEANGICSNLIIDPDNGHASVLEC